MKQNGLFATPKRAVISTLSIVVLAGAVFIGGAAIVNGIMRGNAIGETKAENIAMADAGVQISEAQIQPTEYKFQDGKFMYEVEFNANGMEYEYRIQASDGSIVSRQREKADDWFSVTQTKDQLQEVSENTVPEQEADFSERKSLDISQETAPEIAAGTYIGVDEAKKIAAEHAGVSQQEAVFEKVKLENDHGRNEYEIEFYLNGIEYEYTIDATDGTIIEYEAEYDD
ncbi:MAG: PepSY domain-containing protein [Lachnospiraceae bacterium]|nr:PepSY domain-containing protein [Lachnospiraceae bacterium]